MDARTFLHSRVRGKDPLPRSFSSPSSLKGLRRGERGFSGSARGIKQNPGGEGRRRAPLRASCVFPRETCGGNRGSA